MTREQREILQANLEGDGSTYNIVTITFPDSYRGNPGACDGLKIVSRQIEGDIVDVDVYGPDGVTVDHYCYFAREVMA